MKETNVFKVHEKNPPETITNASFPGRNAEIWSNNNGSKSLKQKKKKKALSLQKQGKQKQGNYRCKKVN